MQQSIQQQKPENNNKIKKSHIFVHCGWERSFWRSLWVISSWFLKKFSQLLDNLSGCLIGAPEKVQVFSMEFEPVTVLLGSNPDEDISNFSGAHMRQSLRLSNNCEDHIFSMLSNSYMLSDSYIWIFII